MVELRCLMLLPLDDLLAVVKEFINPAVSRAGLGSMLAVTASAICANSRPRHLQMLESQPRRLRPSRMTNRVSAYGHQYLPKMPDETEERRYLFVAIDRATRWVFMRIYPDQTENSSVDSF